MSIKWEITNYKSNIHYCVPWKCLRSALKMRFMWVDSLFFLPANFVDFIALKLYFLRINCDLCSDRSLHEIHFKSTELNNNFPNPFETLQLTSNLNRSRKLFYVLFFGISVNFRFLQSLTSNSVQFSMKASFRCFLEMWMKSAGMKWLQLLSYNYIQRPISNLISSLSFGCENK